MMFFPLFGRSSRRTTDSRRSRCSRVRLTVESLEGRASPSSLASSAALPGYVLDNDHVQTAAPAGQIQVDSRQGGLWGDAEDGHHHDDQNATITTTTQFTTIAGGAFIDLPASSFLTPVTSGTVTITASNDANGSFFNFPVGTADAPGSGNGFLDFNRAPFVGSPLTLNFSTPVAAFGVSFMQMAPSIDGANFSSPAVLKVFDAPNGTGNLLGSVTSAGFVPAGSSLGQQSFVAVLSSAQNIRSAVLVGTGPNLGFAVDGYAVSVTPQGGGVGGNGH